MVISEVWFKQVLINLNLNDYTKKKIYENCHVISSKIVEYSFKKHIL